MGELLLGIGINMNLAIPIPLSIQFLIDSLIYSISIFEE